MVRRWLIFFGSGLATGLVIGALKVYVLDRFDAKFSYVPGIAMELEVLGAVVFSLVGGFFFGITSAVIAKRSGRVAEGLLRSALAGASYMIVLELVAALLDLTLDPELLAGPVVLWCYLLLSSILLGWYVTRGPHSS